MPRKAAARSKPKAKAPTRASAARKPPADRKATAKPRAKTMPDAEGATGKSASALIDARLRDLGDWRGETLAQVRRLIHEADPDIVEEVKWVKPTNPWGVPVFSHDGIVCTAEAYQDKVKLTFARGATVPDPRGLFNASLEGSTRRAIDIGEGEALDAEAFRTLMRAAVGLNARMATSKGKGRAGG